MSAIAMPRIIKAYVRYVDAVNRVLGYFVMYLTLVMMGLLLFASVTRYVFNVPFVWIIEMAQFLMAAYYILGGGYSMQLDAHVRMDVLYERWRPKTRAFMDSLTAFFLIDRREQLVVVTLNLILLAEHLESPAAPLGGGLGRAGQQGPVQRW